MIEGEPNSELLPGPKGLLVQWPRMGTAQEKGEQRERAFFAAVGRKILRVVPKQFQVPPVVLAKLSSAPEFQQLLW